MSSVFQDQSSGARTPTEGRTAPGGDGGLQRGSPGAFSLAAGGGDRAPAAGLGEPCRGKGEKVEQEEDGGGGGGVHDRAVCAYRRRGDRGSDDGSRPRNRRPKPANKRVRAELLVGKVALFLWLADEVDAPQPDRGPSPLIFLSDGERALHDRQSEYLPENTICILDLFHVMERLWKVAWCFFDEATQKRKCISG